MQVTLRTASCPNCSLTSGTKSLDKVSRYANADIQQQAIQGKTKETEGLTNISNQFSVVCKDLRPELQQKTEALSGSLMCWNHVTLWDTHSQVTSACSLEAHTLACKSIHTP
ncbi:hypothetical protein CHARACLAT_030548 [Characodon lateralis]|uniref:Uncharacterized protein n=1 Tax=Characodon lateralis TaxID=208331 RepID=A0ABU7DVQ0_9TELE|nr:hypothetical protein [Characodon lateralis]